MFICVCLRMLTHHCIYDDTDTIITSDVSQKHSIQYRNEFSDTYIVFCEFLD